MNDFLEVRGFSGDILTLTRKEPSGILEDFYSNVRMRDGEFYMKDILRRTDPILTLFVILISIKPITVFLRC